MNKLTKINIFLFGVVMVMFGGAGVVKAVTLKLLPSEGSFHKNQTFQVKIILDTQNQKAVGVDIRYLRFNPNLLEVVDTDPQTDGVQISEGILFEDTMVNAVDNTTGRIDFAQISTPGSYFQGEGVLATITFRVLDNGRAGVEFDFTPGETTDTNVAFEGNDILTEVVNGEYLLGTGESQEDVIPPHQVRNFSIVAGDQTAILTWENPSDPDFDRVKIQRSRVDFPLNPNQGLTVYEGADESFVDEDVANNSIYYYTIFAFDTAGNFSSGVSKSVIPQPFSEPEEGTGSRTGTNNQPSSDQTPPTISHVTVITATSTAKIIWATNEPATSRVWYGKAPDDLEKEVSDSQLSTFHLILLSSLSPSTTYYFKIENEDEAGNVRESEVEKFTTKEQEFSSSLVQQKIEFLRAQIAVILETINYLKAKLEQILAKEKKTEEKKTSLPLNYIPRGFKFTKMLRYGDRGIEVRYLQIFLASQGKEIYPEGRVTGYFGILTKRAVIRFQQKYARDILYPWGFTRGTGVVGPTTRKKINQLLGSD